MPVTNRMAKKKKISKKRREKKPSPIVMCVHPPNAPAAVLSNNRASIQCGGWVVAVRLAGGRGSRYPIRSHLYVLCVLLHRFTFCATQISRCGPLEPAHRAFRHWMPVGSYTHSFSHNMCTLYVYMLYYTRTTSMVMRRVCVCVCINECFAYTIKHKKNAFIRWRYWV